MKRRRFTEREVIETLMYSGVMIWCYRCREPFTFDDLGIEREHVTEVGLGGRDAPRNCAYSHKLCHAKITNGTKATTAGSSKQRIAKVRRSPAKFAVHKRKPGVPKPESNWPSRLFPQRRAQ